jgi:hypothetical protein
MVAMAAAPGRAMGDWTASIEPHHPSWLLSGHLRLAILSHLPGCHLTSLSLVLHKEDFFSPISLSIAEDRAPAPAMEIQQFDTEYSPDKVRPPACRALYLQKTTRHNSPR